MPEIAKIVAEIALDREFDYQIPESLKDKICIGSRVRVPFRHTMARGYVVGFADHSDRPVLKTIDSLIGDKPILDKNMLLLARWLADYYACTIEQAIRTVLPCAVRRQGASFRQQKVVILEKDMADEKELKKLRSRAPKQAAALEILQRRGRMPLNALTKATGTSSLIIHKLQEKGFLRILSERLQRDPLASQLVLPTTPLQLAPEQASALISVRQSIDTLKPPVILLHGVTGSGKTEVYLQAIQYVLKEGKGAIVLVPEISLTPQTVERFRSRFGDAIAVLHSHLSDGERHDEWYRIYNGKARIVIGARSALFAPVAKLGLIIVDEEHEPSYKQSEAPRYHARDVAVMRGHMAGCSVLLGSASPSLESFYNASCGKYQRCILPYRVDHREMPAMRIVDMRLETERTGRMNIISRELSEAIHSRLEQHEQIILFLNRRGFATSILCPVCGYVSTCDDCSVALTYHRETVEQLRCHICGRTFKVPQRCPQCGKPTLKFAGIGTQRIETITRKLFPHAAIQRMDSDTTKRKDAYNRILGDFRAGAIDILIGTQMIAKGLHFPRITLVGVIYADLSLHIPDFRASERTFQLLLQVAGRAGRGAIPGEVIIQTFTPFNPAIQAARKTEYEKFAEQELQSRRELMYPPFSHLVCITLDGITETSTGNTANSLTEELKKNLPSSVIFAGPIPAPLSKIKKRYRYQIVMRAASVFSMTRPLKDILRKFRYPSNIHIIIDVDAISMM